MKAAMNVFKRSGQDPWSVIFTWSSGAAALIILGILLVILGDILWLGAGGLSWRFLSSGTEQDMFDPEKAGILPMIIGTTARVFLMTLFVMPVGVITAVYLTEYSSESSWTTRVIRGAVNNLAGVPSIVFGLFGLGFFIGFVGGAMDELFRPEGDAPRWGKPSLLWASLTLAVMTLPVVIVTTEEALQAIPRGMREASMALGATRLQTIIKVILPRALPGILTGAILAISRAAGEVAPILFTGAAYYMAQLPGSLSDQFMDLGYHVFILATQSPNIDRTRPLLYATVLTLVLLTFGLNLVAILVRARMRRHYRTVY